MSVLTRHAVLARLLLTFGGAVFLTADAQAWPGCYLNLPPNVEGKLLSGSGQLPQPLFYTLDTLSVVPPSSLPDPARTDSDKLAYDSILERPADDDIWNAVRRERWRTQSRTEGMFGSLTSVMTTRDPATDPNELAEGDGWRVDEAWQLEVIGPFSFFGQMGAGSNPAFATDLRVAGRGGLALKLAAASWLEMQVRGGPLVTWNDPLRPDRTLSRSELFLEVQARCPLPGQLGLEYQGTALPALAPTERDKLDQELRVNMPFGKAGKLRVGAKHQWENMTSAKPSPDNLQFFLGLELGR